MPPAGPFTDPQHIRYLPVRESVYTIEIEYQAGSDGQLAYQTEQLVTTEFRNCIIIDARLLFAYSLHLPAADHLLLAQGIESGIDNDRSHPGIKGRFRSIITGQFFKDLQ